MSTAGMDAVIWLRDTFAGAGGQDYLGEPVTVAEHMLQCAALARAAGAPNNLVVAALVHDVGHFVGLISGRDEIVAGANPISGRALMSGSNNHHDESGAAWLAQWFGPDVTEPVRMHVNAKRYLCATEPAYFDILSDASKFTLAVQGGPMSATEIAEFETSPYAHDAVAVRRWDDEAKDPVGRTPSFEEFVPAITTATRRRPEPASASTWFRRRTADDAA